MWGLVEKCLRHKDHARGAIATLKGSVVEKGLLQRMELAVGSETLDGGDFFVLGVGGEEQT